MIECGEFGHAPNYMHVHVHVHVRAHADSGTKLASYVVCTISVCINKCVQSSAVQSCERYQNTKQFC